MLSFLRKNPDDFPPGSTTFEATDFVDDREIDVVVNDGGTFKFFELKSYKKSSLPPGDFATQFLKDLNNDGLTDLSNLKWYFDAEKLTDMTESELVDFMIKEVRKIDIPQFTIDKFFPNARPGTKTKEDLIQLIIDNNVFEKK